MAFGVRGFPLGNPFGQGGKLGTTNYGGGPATIDPAMLNALLSQYGVHMPEQYREAGPFEQGGFGQRHPGLAHGLDNALIAVAGMGPTQMAAGENISNAARGVLGVEPYRLAFASQQAMMPLQMASMVGGLQAQQAMLGMYKGMGDYYKNVGDARVLSANAQSQRNQDQLNAAILRQNMLGTKSKRLVVQNGKQVVEEPYIDPADMTMQVHYRPTDEDPSEFMKEHVRNNVTARFGGNTPEGMYISNALASAYGGYDKIPEVIPPAMLGSLEEKAAKLSPSYQGSVLRQDTVPASTTFQDLQKAQEKSVRGLMFNQAPGGWTPKIREGAIQSEMTNEMQRELSDKSRVGPMTPIAQMRANATARVAQQEQTDQQILAHWSAYQQLPPEVRMGMDPVRYFQTQGFDPQTRTWAQPGGPQSAPQTAPGAAVAPAVPNPTNILHFDANGNLIKP